MSSRKIAISVPYPFLEKLDMWATRLGKPRSRFIVDEMEKALESLEDQYITELYDHTYGSESARKETSQLAEELLSGSDIYDWEK